MLKKYIRFSVVFITLFSFNCINSLAYEFVDESHKTLVNDMIVEIYNSKQQYEDLAGPEVEQTIKVYDANNSSYWWPIGSAETVEIDGNVYAKEEPIYNVVTSNYGYRKNPLGEGIKFHSGIDISGGNGPGTVNVIAAKDGIVIYPTAGVSNDCPYSSSSSNCGGGYGNYVIIQHSDGNYTLYAHLHENTITVVAGQSVEQGQVIAKMGSSGNSTGPHLHFEVREGQNAYKATVEPLNYISKENPRVVVTGGDLLRWLNSWEGATRTEGDFYIVEDIGDGVRTVGGGITLENNADRFLQYGIDISKYTVGSKIPISVVDQMQLEVINSKRSYIEGILARESITLEETQIQALISQMYNIGNINGFADAYKKYDNTQDFYDKWFFRSISKGTQFEAGLTRRRNSEWALFSLGEYIYNG